MQDTEWEKQTIKIKGLRSESIGIQDEKNGMAGTCDRKNMKIEDTTQEEYKPNI